LDIKFGAYRLHRNERHLHGPSGSVQLGDRACEILLVLLASPNSVVTKNDLLDAVWPNLAVEENTLQVHISTLRKALGPSHIQTVHGRGYRYVGPEPCPAVPPTPPMSPSAPGAQPPGVQVTPRTLENRPTLPDKPSIAVLAFDNVSGDPEQEFFADGIAGDIITALSRVNFLFVTAQSSSFTYKGRNVDVGQIGRDLGVRYVLEGSVRSTGNRIRITAQLSDATNGKNIWAERYDRDLADIFEIQDEVTRNIVASMHTQITMAEGSIFEGIEQPSLPIWALLARASMLSYRATKESFVESGLLAERALQLDPDSAQAHFNVANALFHIIWLGHAEDPADALARGLQHAERAVRLNAKDEYAHWNLGMLRLLAGEHDRALASLERAIEISPNCSIAHGSLGTVLNYAGMPERSVACNLIAIRSNPLDPTIFFRYGGLALSHFLMGDQETALAWARKSLALRPEWFQSHLVLIACLEALGRTDDWRAAIRTFRKCCPDTTLADVEALPFQHAEDLAKIVGPIRRAMHEAP